VTHANVIASAVDLSGLFIWTLLDSMMIDATRQVY
jgi:hypothetical protein